MKEAKDIYAKGTVVHSRDKQHVGHLTGGSRKCQLEGCTGRALAVRWDDGKLTYPCTKGMDITNNEWVIE